jgi:hypothetical protein
MSDLSALDAVEELKANDLSAIQANAIVRAIGKMQGPQDLSHLATKEDLQRFATKDDLREALKAYPTKDDLREALKAYPTKEDLREALKAYPTKEDLREALEAYATKDDLDKGLSGLRTEIRLSQRNTVIWLGGILVVLCIAVLGFLARNGIVLAQLPRA